MNEKLLKEYRFARPLVAFTIAGVLTADSIWVAAARDNDPFSRINPWVTMFLSIEILIWGFSSRKFISKMKFYISGLEVGLDEGLWLAFGWWVILITRLWFFPQPHQVTGFDRASWLCVYISMAVFSLGNWLLRHRFQHE